MKSSQSESSGRMCVSTVRAEPQQLSPSDAMEKRGHPIIELSALQAAMTVDISHVCLSAPSCLQVLVIMKGLKPNKCLSSERIPMENTVAYHRAYA